ncbi:phosphatase PAP2 family protein [Shigella flexneri]
MGKDIVQEPRPFVVWLEKTHHVPVDELQFKATDRGNVVRSSWRKTGYPALTLTLAEETGFAFPSGHTMFAASWALLAVGLLWPRGELHHCYFAGLGVRRNRQPHAAGMHWRTRFGGGYVDSWELVTVQRCCTTLWTTDAASGREARNRATRTRKFALVDYPNFDHKSSQGAWMPFRRRRENGATGLLR